MHYTIEKVNKDQPFGEILESSRRAGNDPGKAQAFVLARSIGKANPECTVFVNEVVGRDEENIIAVWNANDDVKDKYPTIEYLDLKKRTKLVKLFLTEIENLEKQGMESKKAFEFILAELNKAFETKS